MNTLHESLLQIGPMMKTISKSSQPLFIVQLKVTLVWNTLFLSVLPSRIFGYYFLSNYSENTSKVNRYLFSPCLITTDCRHFRLINGQTFRL